MQNQKLILNTLFTRGKKAKSLFNWESRGGVMTPSGWSDHARFILKDKYLAPQEKSLEQMTTRVLKVLRKKAQTQKIFHSLQSLNAFEQELAFLIYSQRASFNSPVWFNLGVQKNPQVSACFIQSVEDSLDGIFSLAKNEAKLFKYGSGSGTNFSSLRAKGETLESGGTSSGLMSFLDVLDKGAGAIKSGGRNRRAAKMVIVDVDHPEILEFIHWKSSEEKKHRYY